MKFLLCLFLSISGASAQIKTVSLHPLLTDLIQQVGGEQVTVIDLIGKTGDPHHFEPSAEQIKSTQGAVLYFVSGKGLESYLPSLKNIIGNSAKLIEVGATLPSIEGACDHEHHEHDAKNEHEHSIDPHWWHSIENFRRATTVVANELSTASPTQRAYFEKNASAYRTKLEELDRWARKEIAKIPKEKRQLATAHDAFGYFCKDYQFTAIPVQGINREQAPGTAALAALMKELKDHRVTAIFPEKESNPKILTALTKDTGIALAEPLIADGTNVDTYEEMIRHNISAIVKSLSPVRE